MSGSVINKYHYQEHCARESNTRMFTMFMRQFFKSPLNYRISWTPKRLRHTHIKVCDLDKYAVGDEIQVKVNG